MPELPEVETVRRGLGVHLGGRRVVGVRGRPVQLRRPLDPEHLGQRVTGRRCLGIRRRGKYLLLDFEGGVLLGHLGMTGRFARCESGAPPAPHTHLVLELDDASELHFVDPRRFGFLTWLGEHGEATDPALAKLGLEPLGEDLVLALPELVRGRRAPIKALLLDQRLVAGIGNIYATEALWRAGIRPGRPGGRIARRRLEALAGAIRAVLAEAIEQGGTTLRDFARPDGGSGYFAIHLDAYGRQGEPCRRCESPLAHTVIAGRTTAWCRHCQR